MDVMRIMTVRASLEMNNTLRGLFHEQDLSGNLESGKAWLCRRIGNG